MSYELKLNGYPTGATVYAVIENAAGQIWNTSTLAFESYTTANIGAYAVPVTEQATGTGRYRGNFPVGIISAGKYNTTIYQLVGAGPAVSDTFAGSSDLEWTGATDLSVASTAKTQTAAIALGDTEIYNGVTDPQVLTLLDVQGTQAVTLLKDIKFIFDSRNYSFTRGQSATVPTTIFNILRNNGAV